MRKDSMHLCTRRKQPNLGRAPVDGGVGDLILAVHQLDGLGQGGVGEILVFVGVERLLMT